MTRRIVFHILTGLFVGGITLGLCETALRLTGRVTVKSVRTISDGDFDRVPGMFEPLQDLVETPHPKLTHHVTVNAVGFRGKEIAEVKAPDTFRILCLGDSFTYGSYVSDEDTFPALLQREFDRHRWPVEVINGGVGGTTIVDQFYFLKRAIRIAPDLVILTFTENDLADLTRWEPFHVSLEKNRTLKSRFLLGSFYRAVRDTALFNFALLLKANYLDQPRHGVSARTATAVALESTTLDTQSGVYQQHLRELKAYLDGRSVKLVFAIFPSDHRFRGAAPADHNGKDILGRIETVARRLEIPTVNYLEPLQRTRLGPSDLYFLPYDGHPRREAYAQAAKVMFDHLKGEMSAMFSTSKSAS